MKIKILILILISLTTFANTLFHNFVWDDIPMIREDTYIKTTKNLTFFLRPDYWLKDFRGTRGRYRPLRSILFTIEYKLWGLRPQFYHAVNIFLHTVVVVLIFLFLRRWVFVEDERLPFLSAVIFAVYPVHVESVAWIKNCTDLLCMIFFLLSFHFFLKSFDSRTKVLFVIYYLLAIISFGISVLAKEMGVTLPLIILIYLWFVKGERKIVKNLVKVSGYLLILFGVFIYKVFILEPEAPLTVEISFIIKTFGEYLQILLFPFNLCAERRLSKVETFFEPTLLLGIFGIFVIVSIFYYKKNLRFPLLWFLITILPVLNIIYLEGRPLAEQRLYIPSLGFCMVLGDIFARAWDKNLVKTLFVLLVCTYGIIAIDRNYDWKDSPTFWEKTLYQTGSPRAFLNLGEAYLQLGDDELGIRVSKQALRYDPSLIGAMANIGIGYMKLGDKEKALDYFRKALFLQPDDPSNYVNLGVALLELKHIDEARKVLEKGLQVSDRNALLHYTLGNVYGQLGLFDKAAERFRTAMILDPDLKMAERNYKQALKDLQKQKRNTK